MYLDTSTIKQKGKIYTRHLLRESYREDGKVRHRTIANLNRCSENEISAIRLALRHKENLHQLISLKESVSFQQGLSMGAVWVIYDMAKQLGIVEALGTNREGKLALWQVIARVINQGSRLSAVRLAGGHAACDILGLEKFNEDDLYKNLDWLCEKQTIIEDRLYRKDYQGRKGGLYLYDVTSSYLEGEKNELASFGYNRDGKKGKRQIVIGLLCDEEGKPLSIEVFKGNTQDPKTLFNQIKKTAERFGGKEVTFVGDRGMIKSKGVEELKGYGFHYITAITKPQIEKLLNKGIFQLGLFEQELAEIETDENVRYILRRNPVRGEEIKKNREGKYLSVCKLIEKENVHLEGHSRSKVETALKKIKNRCERLNISDWVLITVNSRKISITKDEEVLGETSKLDGCYVLKTDLLKKAVSKEVIHNRYKDLSLVERAFSAIKTTFLEVRPVYLRLEERTRGHVFVVMLAYQIIRELEKSWQTLNVTTKEGIEELTTLCNTELRINGVANCNQIPEPRERIKELLKLANVRLPKILPSKGVIVSTKKKLQKQRKNL